MKGLFYTVEKQAVEFLNASCILFSVNLFFTEYYIEVHG